jgi:hypothetical protein
VERRFAPRPLTTEARQAWISSAVDQRSAFAVLAPATAVNIAITVPNARCCDELRTPGLKTRAFENLVGIAMVNYPHPLNNGHS